MTSQQHEAQKVHAHALGLAEAQPVAVVQSVPGAHPVPLYAFSIKDPPYSEETSNTTTPKKRKSRHTHCSKKLTKLESEEDKEARLAPTSPEQPRHSTSKAVPPPQLDGPPSPESPIIRKELLLPNNNHVLGDAGEAEERIVVISSSEDSDARTREFSSKALRPRLSQQGWKIPQGPAKCLDYPSPPTTQSHEPARPARIQAMLAKALPAKTTHLHQNVQGICLEKPPHIFSVLYILCERDWTRTQPPVNLSQRASVKRRKGPEAQPPLGSDQTS
ncbi:Hypothetical predicted protein [Marmota monax]|uniref:PML-like coiled-coil domain-containing protein n=1 Tax=Marmota monax TaxID=9995 RepID=A0A5E4B6M7_MARMO|nr:Hypothetical predicted protein [Marmota monax]